MADDFPAEEGSLPSTPDIDLLGDPWCALRDPRGRRKLRFAKSVYDKVETFKAAGMSDEAIAQAVGVGKATIQRVFGPELESGLAKKRAELLAITMELARDGKIPAIKLAFALIEKGASAPPSARPPKPEKLGKKQDVARRARELDDRSEWGRLLN